MNHRHPFTADDLSELDARLLSQAAACVAMEDVHDGNHDADVVGLRHDVDAGHALATAVLLAEWECDRGYRATYFLLHTAPYWNTPGFQRSVERLADCGHEVGIHTNAVAESLRTGVDPDVILERALAELRGCGVAVRGVVGHGDALCVRAAADGESVFSNDEQFLECARPGHGRLDREIRRGSMVTRLHPRPLGDFGLEYEAVRAGVGQVRVSDSGGCWSEPFDDVVAGFGWRQLHLLWHPDWWAEALPTVADLAMT